MNIAIGILLFVAGFVQLGVARDKKLWVSYAVESFRYLMGWGHCMLGLRFVWIYFYGDEPGVSLWAQCALISIGIGLLGIQTNNLSHNTLHVPKFLRKVIE